MKIFITGTDTDIGKTLVSSWLCAHTQYPYFKPIQTGSRDSTDSLTVAELTRTHIYPESYIFSNPLSPHLAAADENTVIDLKHITLPKSEHLIIEGAGGLLVPLNDDFFISDLILHFNVPALLVASSKLGTINHTLLSIAWMRQQNVPLLGVILSGPLNPRNKHSIEQYGHIKVLAELPYIEDISFTTLKNIPLPVQLHSLLEVQHDFSTTR